MQKITLSLFLLVILSSIAACQIESNISNTENPAAPNSEFPFLFSTDESLYMSWITHHSQDRYSLNYARLSDGQWTPPTVLASDSTWFVNWADFPSLIADGSGAVAAHWLDKTPGGPYAYNINISFHEKDTWSQPLTPHFDSTATEHGFVSMVPWDKQNILAVWLDGRETANRDDEEYYNLDKAMTLRAAMISKNGEIRQKFLIDDSVCDCCQTSLIRTSEGAVVAYRNRTENEIRDIYTSRFDGKSWASPQTVFEDNWKIGACPVNGPKLAASDSLVAISWYTAARKKPLVKAAISTDGGTTFNAPLTLNDSTALGRVDAAASSGEVYVSWVEKTSKEGVLKVKKISGGETTSVAREIAAINRARATGFPQMEIINGSLYFAWTDIDQAHPRVKTAQMPLTSF